MSKRESEKGKRGGGPGGKTLAVLLILLAAASSVEFFGDSRMDTILSPPASGTVGSFLDRAKIPKYSVYGWKVEQAWGEIIGDPFGLEEPMRTPVVVHRRGAAVVGRERVLVSRKDLDRLGGKGAALITASLIFVESKNVRVHDLGESVVLGERGIRWNPAEEDVGLERTAVLRLDGLDGEVVFVVPGVVVTRRMHILGTDEAGYDMMRKLLRTIPTSIAPGLLAVGIGLLGGIVVGILESGFLGRPWVDPTRFLMSVGLSLPLLLVMLMAIATLEVNQVQLMVVLGLASIPRIAQVISEKIQSFQALQFVEAALELGVTRRNVLGKHILWSNCRELIFAQGAFLFADVVMLEATVSYFRFGSGATIGSLGGLIARGQGGIVTGQFWTVFPAIALLSIVILTLHLVGDWVGRRADV